MNFSSQLLEELEKDPVPVMNRGYMAKQRIAERQERIISWRQIAESITANPENTPGGSGPGNKTEKCVLSILELEEEITGEIADLAAFESRTSGIIQAFVKEPAYQTVLEMRYLSYERWERIAVKMGYTFRWTQELHRRAIAELKRNAGALLKKAR